MKLFFKSFSSFLLFSAFFILASYDISFAGAWGMKKGSLYERLSFNYYFADRNYDKDGDAADFPNNGSFRDYHLSQYLEYGLLDNLTIINSVYFKSIRKNDYTVQQKTAGVGDVDLGAKVQIIKLAEGILSVQTIAKFPWAYEKDEGLPLGNGQTDLELRFLYGHSLYPLIPGYCNFEIAYRWRLQDPADEIRYLVEAGVDITKNLYGRIKLDGVYGMDNGKEFDTSGNPTNTNNYDIGKLDAVLGYRINKKWGVEAGYTPSIYGKNTAKGATYTFAVTFLTP